MRLPSGHTDGSSPDSARSEVVDTVKERIITGELPPGSWLRERTVSEEFGVSRVPVREAFFVLEHQRLIRAVPRRGVVVTALTRHDVIELFEVRTAVDPLMAELAARSRTAQDVATLTLDLDAGTRAAQEGDLTAGSLANASFHSHLLEATHNDLLISMASPLDLQIQRIFRRTIGGHETELRADHAALLAAIVAGDHELAHRLAADHVAATRERSLEAADPDPAEIADPG